MNINLERRTLLIFTITSPYTTENCYLFSDSGHCLIIDPNDPEKIHALLTAQKLIPDRIILTHEHFDHIEGLEPLRRFFRIPVLCSAMTSIGITQSDKNLSIVYDLCTYEQSGHISEIRHQPFQCEPAEETFQEEKHMTFGSHHLWLKRCPGHSPGSSIIFVDHQILFSGDYLIPDEPVNLSLRGGSETDYLTETLPFLRTLLMGIHIYPGHGHDYLLQNSP